MPAPRGLQSLAPIQPSDGIEAHEAANDYIDECGFKDRNGLRASWKAKNRVRACRQLGSGGGEAGSRPGFAASEATVLLSYATNPRNSRRDSNPDLVIGQKRRLKIRSSPPGRGSRGATLDGGLGGLSSRSDRVVESRTKSLAPHPSFSGAVSLSGPVVYLRVQFHFRAKRSSDYRTSAVPGFLRLAIRLDFERDSCKIPLSLITPARESAAHENVTARMKSPGDNSSRYFHTIVATACLISGIIMYSARGNPGAAT